MEPQSFFSRLCHFLIPSRACVALVLLLVSFCAPAACGDALKGVKVTQGESKEPSPLFMSPEFRFSQVDTICVAPSIDLRLDKTQLLNLSEKGPRVTVGFGGGYRPPSADDALAGRFQYIGYKTVGCNPVVGALDDLRRPSDAWLRKLDFGESRWLFILAVEDVASESASYRALGGAAYSQSTSAYAVVSGCLFEKQAAGARLVWRDRVVGRSATGVEGARQTAELVGSETAVADGIDHLLATFETRNKKIKFLYERDTAETYDGTCNVLWTAVNDTLKNSKDYRITQTDDSDMMIIYTFVSGKIRVQTYMDYVVLRSQENSCEMHIVEVPPVETFNKETGDLIKRVRATLSK